jgi:hypothetical protein
VQVFWLSTCQQHAVDCASTTHRSGLNVPVLSCHEQIRVGEVQELRIIIIAISTWFNDKDRMVRVVCKS